MSLFARPDGATEAWQKVRKRIRAENSDYNHTDAMVLGDNEVGARNRKPATEKKQRERKEQFWGVKRLIGQRRNGGRLEYLVEWEGADEKDQPWEPTWEPATNVTDAAIKEWNTQTKIIGTIGVGNFEQVTVRWTNAQHGDMNMNRKQAPNNALAAWDAASASAGQRRVNQAPPAAPPQQSRARRRAPSPDPDSPHASDSSASPPPVAAAGRRRTRARAARDAAQGGHIVFENQFADGAGQRTADALYGPANNGYPGQHPHNRDVDVSWTDSHRGFQINRKFAFGLLGRLLEAFYPTYSWEAVQRRAAENSREQRGQRPMPSYRSKDLKLNGLQLGGHVDAQVKDVVDLLQRASVDEDAVAVNDVLNLQRALPRHILHSRYQGLDHLRSDWHPYTRRVFQALWRMRLVPVCSQLLVASNRCNVGTAADLVCVHVPANADPATFDLTAQDNDRLIVELKTGFDNYLLLPSTPRARMSPPFQDWNDCPLHQHFLQAAFTTVFYNDTFPLHTAQQAYVCRVHRNGVDMYRVPDRLMDLARGEGYDTFRDGVVAGAAGAQRRMGRDITREVQRALVQRRRHQGYPRGAGGPRVPAPLRGGRGVAGAARRAGAAPRGGRGVAGARGADLPSADEFRGGSGAPDVGVRRSTRRIPRTVPANNFGQAAGSSGLDDTRHGKFKIDATTYQLRRVSGFNGEDVDIVAWNLSTHQDETLSMEEALILSSGLNASQRSILSMQLENAELELAVAAEDADPVALVPARLNRTDSGVTARPSMGPDFYGQVSDDDEARTVDLS